MSKRLPPTPIPDVLQLIRTSSLAGTREALEYYKKMYPNIYKNLVTFFTKAQHNSK